jgi:Papain family cysteine protease
MSRFGKGWIKSKLPGKRDFLAHSASKSAAAGLPTKVDNASKGPGLFDQGQAGSCWGHAQPRGIVITLESAGTPLGFVPSMDALYRAVRALQRAQSGSRDVPLDDAGSDPIIGMQAMSLFGVQPMKVQQTSDGRYSDCEVAPALLNAEMNLAEVEKESTHLLVGEYMITAPSGAGRVLQVRQALAAGLGITAGFFCDMGFENWNAGDPPYGAPLDSNDPQGGGHDVHIDGYEMQPNGSCVFLVANSWSTSWGDAGRIRVTEAWLNDAQAGDLCVLAIKES